MIVPHGEGSPKDVQSILRQSNQMPETIPTQAERPIAGRVYADALRDLAGSYMIEDPSAVSRFISENRLGELLFEALTPLTAVFGSQATCVLRLVSDSEG